MGVLLSCFPSFPEPAEAAPEKDVSLMTEDEMLQMALQLSEQDK